MGCIYRQGSSQFLGIAASLKRTNKRTNQQKGSNPDPNLQLQFGSGVSPFVGPFCWQEKSLQHSQGYRWTVKATLPEDEVKTVVDGSKFTLLFDGDPKELEAAEARRKQYRGGPDPGSGGL